jgi:hypothetical protein
MPGSDTESADITEEQVRAVLEVLVDHHHWALGHYDIGTDIVPIHDPAAIAGEVQSLADQRLGDTEETDAGE